MQSMHYKMQDRKREKTLVLPWQSSSPSVNEIILLLLREYISICFRYTVVYSE